MRKFLFITVVILSLLPVTLKSQQVVLVEVCTNASCGPCAGANPIIDNLAAQNPDKMIVLKYHTSWPGKDPFYSNNTGENTARTSYYNVTGVPAEFINGQRGNPNQNLINQLYNNTPIVDLDVYKELDTDNKIFKMDVVVKAKQNITLQNPKVLIAVVENIVTFNVAPGFNGEKVFRDPLVKFIPSINKNQLPNDIYQGDYFIFSYEWDYSDYTIYNEPELDLRVFIQDDTKKVYNATRGVFDSPAPGSMVYDNDMEVIEIKGIAEKTCENVFSPIIKIRNNGNNPVTSAVIKYQFNDETEYEYTWTGNLNSLETAEIQLPETEILLLPDDNSFEVSIESVNGMADQYDKNNEIEFDFDATINSNNFVKLVLRTDKKPQETTWKLTHAKSGNVVAEGGPYTDAQTMYTEEINLPAEADCYTFTLYDAGGDGICCLNGSGFFGLENNEGKVIISGGQFGSEISAQFAGNGYLPVEDIQNAEDFTFYPNPTSGIVNIDLNANNSTTATIDVYSVVGMKMLSKQLNLTKGYNNINLDLSSFNNGLYIINLKQDNKIETFKVNLIK